MAAFAMCRECGREYHDPRDRRFHAQPNCCPACGPRLRAARRRGQALSGPGPGAVTSSAGPRDPAPAASAVLDAAAALLRAGAVVAVKGLGGYHLAVRA